MIRPMFQYIKNLNIKNIVGAEIGVKQGNNAFSILNNLDIHKLYLIDPYLPYRDWDGYIQKSGFFDMLIALTKLKSFNNYIEFIFKSSKYASKKIKNNSLDFVYIDGNHCYERVYRDVCLWFEKVRSGGVFGGHDFDYVHNSVMVAVLDFIDKNNLSLFELDNGDWWLIK